MQLNKHAFFLSGHSPCVQPVGCREQENERDAAPCSEKGSQASSAGHGAGAAEAGQCASTLERAGRTLQHGGGYGQKVCHLPLWWVAVFTLVFSGGAEWASTRHLFAATQTCSLGGCVGTPLCAQCPLREPWPASQIPLWRKSKLPPPTTATTKGGNLFGYFDANSYTRRTVHFLWAV